MCLADGDGHSPNAHRERITAEWTKMEWLHRDALVEPEMP